MNIITRQWDIFTVSDRCCSTAAYVPLLLLLLYIVERDVFVSENEVAAAGPPDERMRSRHTTAPLNRTRRPRGLTMMILGTVIIRSEAADFLCPSCGLVFIFFFFIYHLTRRGLYQYNYHIIISCFYNNNIIICMYILNVYSVIQGKCWRSSVITIYICLCLVCDIMHRSGFVCFHNRYILLLHVCVYIISWRMVDREIPWKKFYRFSAAINTVCNIIQNL